MKNIACGGGCGQTQSVQEFRAKCSRVHQLALTEHDRLNDALGEEWFIPGALVRIAREVVGPDHAPHIAIAVLGHLSVSVV